MAITNTDRSIAAGVERARETAGLTQLELIAQLSRRDLDEGVRISRSHYANIVSGQAAFTAHHLSALASILKLDTVCRSEIWQRWGRLPTVADSDEWAEAAERIGRGMLDPASDERANVPDEHVRSVTEHLRNSTDSVLVVRGGWRNVYSIVVSAMRIARDGLVLGDHMIHVLGFGKVGLRPRGDNAIPAAGLHPAIRRELVRSMNAGWRCRHSIHPGEVRSSEPAGLVRMISPMLRYSRYEARLLGTDLPLTTAGLMVIGEYAALDFYSTTATGEVDSVIVHRSPEAVKLFRDYAERLSEVQLPLYTRYERSRSERNPVLTDGERRFREEQLEASRVGGRVDFMLLRIPNPLLPAGVYERSVRARELAVNSAWGTTRGRVGLATTFDRAALTRDHDRRAAALMEQLAKWEEQMTSALGLAHRQRRKSLGPLNPGCRVVLGRNTLMELAASGAVEGSGAWRILTGAEIVDIIDHVVTLAEKFPNALELVVVDEAVMPSMVSDDRARWEIRSHLSGGGRVLFQMFPEDDVETNGADTGDAQERRIHLTFADDDVVRAFRAFTDKMCEPSPQVQSGPDAVAYLRDELRPIAAARKD